MDRHFLNVCIVYIQRKEGKMVDPKESEGARLERAVFRNRLRRMIKFYCKEYSLPEGTELCEVAVLQEELNWILARQKRYDSRKGGLGK